MHRTTMTLRFAGTAIALVTMAACSGQSQGSTDIQDGTDMDALVAAAQAEGKLTAYWASGRSIDAGKVFTEKYGIEVEATKMTDAETTERLVREVDAGNVLADVIGYDDGPRLVTELLPADYVENYVPPQFKDVIPESAQDPLALYGQVWVLGYNTERYGDECPITNMWQLTEPEWTGKLHMLDPERRSTQIQWFSAIDDHSEQMAAAYQELKGAPLDATEETAGREFTKRLAQNRPIVYNEDVELAEAVGARGQSDPPVGIYTLGRHREIEEKNLALGFCDLGPFSALYQPTFGQIIKGAPHPNAARLWMNFLLTEEGAEAWTRDMGAFSTNPTVPSHPNNPYPSLDAWGAKLLQPDNASVASNREALLDLWTKNNS